MPEDPTPAAEAACATPGTNGACTPPLQVPAGGEYRVLTEDDALTNFKLNGQIAAGTTPQTKRYLFGITSSTSSHMLYRIDTLTDTIDSKSLINFPVRWEQLSTHSSTKWRYKLPDSHKSSHPCRCTSSDTDWKQGSGLPWQRDESIDGQAITFIDGDVSFEIPYRTDANTGLAMTLADAAGAPVPWVGGLEDAGCTTAAVTAVPPTAGCGMNDAQRTAFLDAHTVGYYPATTSIDDTSCAVLEPRLCSLAVTERAGNARTISYVDMCYSRATTNDFEPEPRQTSNPGLGGANYCILNGCCSCTHGLCDAATAVDAGTNTADASFQLDFTDGWGGAGWQGIQLAPYTAASPRPTNYADGAQEPILTTSINHAQRMYAVSQPYGVLKYDLAADGTPTFLGTVLQCEDHKGNRMSGATAKLTMNSPGDGHAEGMFVVCERRDSVDLPDAAYLFYCALDTTSAATWREQGRCAYVAGGGQLLGGVDVPDFQGGTDTAKKLNNELVRDIVILNAVVAGTSTTYDLVTVESRVPTSKMYRYSVTIDHGSTTSSPSVTAVSSVEFLDGNDQELKDATGRDVFDFWAAAVQPDSGAHLVAPKAPPAELYVTDYSFNAIIKVRYTAAGPAEATGARMFGTKAAMVPAGVPMFIDGPVAAQSYVHGFRDSVAGHKVYVKITAHNVAGQPANEDEDQAAHIQVAVTGQVSIGGQDVTVVIPGTIVARNEDIYSTGCECTPSGDPSGCECAQNVFWAHYVATQAGVFSASATMGPFAEHVVGSPQSVTVVPTAVDPQKTLVVRDGDANVRAGQGGVLLISTFDEFGNKRTVGLQTRKDPPEAFLWSLKTQPNGMNVINRRDTYNPSVQVSNAPVELTDADLRGQCEMDVLTLEITPYWQGEADYEVFRAGTYQFQMIMQVNNIDYNVYVDTVVVLPSEISRGHCTAESEFFYRAEVNEVTAVISTPISVKITPRDQYSNPVTTPQTFVIDRREDTYGRPLPMDCLYDAAAGEYDCNPVWIETAQQTYDVRFYLDDGTLVDDDGVVTLSSEELEATNTLIGTMWPAGGGATGIAEIHAVSKDGTPPTCDDLENINIAIQLVTALVICIGLGMSVWLAMSRASSFIRMTSPVLGQVIIWGGVIHLFSVLLWTIDPGESGWSSDGFNFCSVRMWTFSMSFGMIWGTLSLKTYRVKELVIQQSNNAAGYQEISDSKLLTYVLLIVFAEMAISCVYSFYDEGPQYDLKPCPAGIPPQTFCDTGETFNTFAAMLAVFNGALVIFALIQAIQTRGVLHQAVGGGDNAAQAQNSAAAFVEAPHIGFSIYNMAFTSVVLYPACGLMNPKTSATTYTLLRSGASIWSCFIVFVFVFGLKIRDKNKFDEQERLNRSQKLSARQLGGGPSSYSDGGMHSMRGGGQPPPAAGGSFRGQSPGRQGGGMNPAGGSYRGQSPMRGGPPPGARGGRSPQRGGPQRGGPPRGMSPQRGGPPRGPPASGENWA